MKSAKDGNRYREIRLIPVRDCVDVSLVVDSQPHLSAVAAELRCGSSSWGIRTRIVQQHGSTDCDRVASPRALGCLIRSEPMLQ